MAYDDPTLDWFAIWADAKTLERRNNTYRWRLDNPEKRRALDNRMKRQRKAKDPVAWRKKQAGAMRAWRAQNPEQYAAAMKRWRDKHADHFHAYRHRHYAKNATLIKAAVKRWRTEHPEQWRASHTSSEARRRRAEGHFKASDIAALWELQRGLCVYCQVDLTLGMDIDHRTPIVRGGSNWPDNLQLLCPSCNKRKHARTDEEFRALLLKESA